MSASRTQLPPFDSVAILPESSHDQELLKNVHPIDWSNPEPQGTYHLVVLGAGTAGLVTAAGAAGLGARVALIERDLMGGDCLNVGCVPSKGVLSAARVAAGVRESHQFGINLPSPLSVDFQTTMERMRRLRANISPHDSAERFQKLGVDVFLGQASFTDSNTISVQRHAGETQRLNFKKAVIATGARAASPAIPGLDAVKILTNENVFSLTELPGRMGVIGTGPIGCELAQAFARLGSQVTIFGRSGALLSKEDPRASRILAEQFQNDGIDLRLNSREMQIRRGQAGAIDIDVSENGQRIQTSVDQLLVAVGRAPNVAELNLGSVGVETTAGGVVVNDFLQTTNPTIYAAGDICSDYKFTHAADFQARIVIQNALFALGPFGRKRASQLIIPWATYTSPEVAHVGLTEHAAEQSGVTVDTYVQDMASVDRAILDGQTKGFVKVLTRKGSDKILGATIVAEHAGDLISEITLAMKAGLGLSEIGSTIHPYPTQAEAIRRLGDQYSRTRLTSTAQQMLRWLMKINVGN